MNDMNKGGISMKSASAVAVLFLASIASCASVGNPQDEVVKEQKISHVPSYFELTGVRFKSHRPLGEEKIETALAEPVSMHLGSLEKDAQLLIKYPKETAEIIGHTDDIECTGSACDELSSRRAEMISVWLLQRGVPKNQLKNPAGFGNKYPISSNATEAGRANNRRVEINFL